MQIINLTELSDDELNELAKKIGIEKKSRRFEAGGSRENVLNALFGVDIPIDQDLDRYHRVHHDEWMIARRTEDAIKTICDYATGNYGFKKRNLPHTNIEHQTVVRNTYVGSEIRASYSDLYRKIIDLIKKHSDPQKHEKIIEGRYTS